MEKLKIGVFGGARGSSMMNILKHHPHAELVAVCDKYKPILDNVRRDAEERGVKVACYESFDQFMNHDMDAVILANYANEHVPYAIRLLDSGRHVMTEVLPCQCMAEAVQLIEAVERSGKVYAYAENYCYMRHTFEMRRRYEAGEIGEVQYAEGEYIHDCSAIWPGITYGERDHWRNTMFATFYCTHSIGPMLTITGRRPVQVVGFETQPNMQMLSLGSHNALPAGIELITLDNGAVAKSVHGTLKREPGSINYEIYGSKGMMESERFDGGRMTIYKEGEHLCVGERETYAPGKQLTPSMDGIPDMEGHGGSDFYPTHYFIEKILGNPDGEKYSIDVYHAVDMGICGILAYKSILAGNKPMKVPNLRNKEERDEWRNDFSCTDVKVAGDQLLPMSSHGSWEIPDEAYERVRQLWLDGKNA